MRYRTGRGLPLHPADRVPRQEESPDQARPTARDALGPSCCGWQGKYHSTRNRTTTADDWDHWLVGMPAQRSGEAVVGTPLAVTPTDDTGSIHTCMNATGDALTLTNPTTPARAECPGRFSFRIIANRLMAPCPGFPSRQQAREIPGIGYRQGAHAERTMQPHLCWIQNPRSHSAKPRSAACWYRVTEPARQGGGERANGGGPFAPRSHGGHSHGFVGRAAQALIVGKSGT